MKAIVYTTYGPPEVLHVAEIGKPAPEEDEILIRVRAAEATKSDCELRSFNFPVKWFEIPLRIALGVTKPRNQILGGYFSGEVEAVGSQVTRFKPGDKVFGTAQFRFGAYGEYVCLPDSYTIVPMPQTMTFEEAAAVPLGGLNALHYLRRANIKTGERILIVGAGGSIGTFGVQIAKAMGAEVTVVDSGIKEDMLRGIGADHFIDYTKEDFTQSDQTYDVIFSVVVQKDYAGCINALNPNGRLLLANPRLRDMFRTVLTTRFSDKQAIFAFAGEKEEELLVLKELAEAGKIKSAVDKVFTMDQAPEAHRRVETEQRVGLTVISMQNV